MEIDIVSVGKRLRNIRMQKGMTLEELADKSGFTHVFIGQIERGARLGSLDSLVKIVNALGVSIEDILVDSLEVINSNVNDELSYLLLDCSEKETKVIIKNAENLRTLLKKYK